MEDIRNMARYIAGPLHTTSAQRKAQLLRDFFGSEVPTHTSQKKKVLPVRPEILKWRDGIIHNLANAVYEDREMPNGHFKQDRVMILADALEEAGYTGEELLRHLRETPEGPHVRGCWALDAILGKD